MGYFPIITEKPESELIACEMTIAKYEELEACAEGKKELPGFDSFDDLRSDTCPLCLYFTIASKIECEKCCLDCESRASAHPSPWQRLIHFHSIFDCFEALSPIRAILSAVRARRDELLAGNPKSEIKNQKSGDS